MSGVAVAIGGSALVGGIIASQSQKSAANKAANASQYGTDQSVGLQRYMYDTSRNDFAPFLNVGTQALYDAFGYTPTTQINNTLAGNYNQTGGYTLPGMSGLDTYNALKNGINVSGAPMYSYGTNQQQGTPYNPALGQSINMKMAEGGTGFTPQQMSYSSGANSGTAIQPRQEFMGSQGSNWVSQPGGVIKTGQGIDPTGGSGKYMDMLESLKFQLDPTDEIYKWREQQTNKAINEAAAARGMYNSRPTINALGDANMALQESEINRQFQQNYLPEYGKLTDLYNMANQQGQTQYNKLLDAIKIGQGAAGSTGTLGANAANQMSSAFLNNANAQGNIALQQGQNNASLWSGIGSMPLNYMMLQNMFGGGNTWSGLGSSGGGTAYNPAYMSQYGY